MIDNVIFYNFYFMTACCPIFLSWISLKLTQIIFKSGTAHGFVFFCIEPHWLADSNVIEMLFKFIQMFLNLARVCNLKSLVKWLWKLHELCNSAFCLYFQDPLLPAAALKDVTFAFWHEAYSATPTDRWQTLSNKLFCWQVLTLVLLDPYMLKASF